MTTTVVGDEVESVAQIFEQLIPSLRELDGYRGCFLLSEHDDSRSVVVTLWETRDAMEASEPIADKMKRAETANRDLEIEDTRHYRVDSFDLSR